MEIRLKSLRQLLKLYYRKATPLLDWSSKLIALFEELNVAITSSPILERFDQENLTFLETDWSAECM